MPAALLKKKWFIWPAVVFVLLRTILLVIEYNLAGNSDFAQDQWNFGLGLEPFSVLTFQTDISGYSQPPLYPIVISPLAFPLSWIFDRFLASRICFTILELIGFWLMALLLVEYRDFRDKTRASIMTIMALSPLGFMTGAVMKQEEAIVMSFTAAVLLAWKKGSIKWASILTFLGIFTAKILFGITFLPLLLQKKYRRDVFIWGILPTSIFTIAYGIAGYIKTGSIPFLGFTPAGVWFCSSVYSLIGRFHYLSGPAMKMWSLGLLGISSIALLANIKRIKNDDFPLLYLLSYLLMFLLFYHINNEYYIFILPLLALVPYTAYGKPREKIFNILHFALGISAWGYGIIYGIRVFGSESVVRSQSKEMALEAFRKVFGSINPFTIEIVLLISTLVILLALTCMTLVMVFRQRPGAIAQSPP